MGIMWERGLLKGISIIHKALYFNPSFYIPPSLADRTLPSLSLRLCISAHTSSLVCVLNLFMVSEPHVMDPLMVSEPHVMNPLSVKWSWVVDRAAVEQEGQNTTEPGNTGLWLAENQSYDLNNEVWLVVYLVLIDGQGGGGIEVGWLSWARNRKLEIS